MKTLPVISTADEVNANWLESIRPEWREQELAFGRRSPVKHLGPGNHPSGSSQDVHGSGGGASVADVADIDGVPLYVEEGCDPVYVSRLKKALQKASVTIPGGRWSCRSITMHKGRFDEVYHRTSTGSFDPRDQTLHFWQCGMDPNGDDDPYGMGAEWKITVAIENGFDRFVLSHNDIESMVMHEWAHVRTVHSTMRLAELAQGMLWQHDDVCLNGTIGYLHLGEYSSVRVEEFIAEAISSCRSGTPYDAARADLARLFIESMSGRFAKKEDDIVLEWYRRHFGATTKHLGPGNHPSGSPQSVHGTPGGEAAWQARNEPAAPPLGPIMPWERFSTTFLLDKDTIVGVSLAPRPNIVNVGIYDVPSGELIGAYLSEGSDSKEGVAKIKGRLEAQGTWYIRESARMEIGGRNVARPWQGAYATAETDDMTFTADEVRGPEHWIRVYDKRTGETIAEADVRGASTGEEAISVYREKLGDMTPDQIKRQMWEERRSGERGLLTGKTIVWTPPDAPNTDTDEDRLWLSDIMGVDVVYTRLGEEGEYDPSEIVHATHFYTPEAFYKTWRKIAGKDANVAKLRQVFEFEIAGVKTKITGVSQYGDNEGITLSGKAEMGEKRIAEFVLTLKPEEAHHGLLVVTADRQGAGLAALAVERIEGEYKKIGIKRIYMLANYNVGGYAWARMGYDFEPGNTGDGIGVFDNYLIAAMKEDGWSAADIGEADAAFLALEHAWEVAAFEWKGKRYGKQIMLGSQWYGVKELGGEGDRIGEEYLRARLLGGAVTAGKSGRLPGGKTSAKPGWCTYRSGDGYEDLLVWDDIDGEVDDAWFAAVTAKTASKHMGPGPHPSGSSQDVHGKPESEGEQRSTDPNKAVATVKATGSAVWVKGGVEVTMTPVSEYVAAQDIRSLRLSLGGKLTAKDFERLADAAAANGYQALTLDAKSAGFWASLSEYDRAERQGILTRTEVTNEHGPVRFISSAFGTVGARIHNRPDGWQPITDMRAGLEVLHKDLGIEHVYVHPLTDGRVFNATVEGLFQAKADIRKAKLERLSLFPDPEGKIRGRYRGDNLGIEILGTSDHALLEAAVTRSEGWLVDNTAEGIAYHEYAHATHMQSKFHTVGATNHVWGRMSRQLEWLRANVSGYAAANDLEMMAEILSNHNGKTPAALELRHIAIKLVRADGKSEQAALNAFDLWYHKMFSGGNKETAMNKATELELLALLEVDASKHLPGQHDQKKHGKPGPGGASTPDDEETLVLAASVGGDTAPLDYGTPHDAWSHITPEHQAILEEAARVLKLDSDKIVAEQVANIERLRKENPELFEKWRNWYRTAHEDIAAEAEKLGISTEQLSAIVAVTSASQTWEGNVALATNFTRWYQSNPEVTLVREYADKIPVIGKDQAMLDSLFGGEDTIKVRAHDIEPDLIAAAGEIRVKGGFTAGDANVKRPRYFQVPFRKSAHILRETKSVWEVLRKSAKQASFTLNLTSPESRNACTIDLWMMRIASGDDRIGREPGKDPVTQETPKWDWVHPQTGEKMKITGDDIGKVYSVGFKKYTGVSRVKSVTNEFGMYAWHQRWVEEVASRTGLTPPEAQAIMWSYARELDPKFAAVRGLDVEEGDSE